MERKNAFVRVLAYSWALGLIFAVIAPANAQNAVVADAFPHPLLAQEGSPSLLLLPDETDDSMPGTVPVPLEPKKKPSARLHQEYNDTESGETKLGIGVNFLGGELAWQPTQGTRLEARYQRGTNGSGTNKVISNVAGLRGYKLFWERSATRPYLGVEASYVADGEPTGGLSANGYAGGAFIGIERRLFSRLWLGVDAGPYIIYLRDKMFGMTQTNLEFVVNTSLIFYLL